jgi:hypothetical protein
MRTPLLIDLRNIYNPQDIAEHGLRYVSLGRGEIDPALAVAAAG